MESTEAYPRRHAQHAPDLRHQQARSVDVDQIALQQLWRTSTIGSWNIARLR